MRKKEELLNNILCDVRKNARITQNQLGEKYYLTERQIRRYMKILKDKGIIRLKGTGKIREWIIVNDRYSK